MFVHVVVQKQFATWIGRNWVVLGELAQISTLPLFQNTSFSPSPLATHYIKCLFFSHTHIAHTHITHTHIDTLHILTLHTLTLHTHIAHTHTHTHRTHPHRTHPHTHTPTSHTPTYAHTHIRTHPHTHTPTYAHTLLLKVATSAAATVDSADGLVYNLRNLLKAMHHTTQD